jgi:threonine dehydrogenase-like Zn-dependent dehydrogenase
VAADTIGMLTAIAADASGAPRVYISDVAPEEFAQISDCSTIHAVDVCARTSARRCGRPPTAVQDTEAMEAVNGTFGLRRLATVAELLGLLSESPETERC